MVRLICSQPASTYYAWQVEVMLQNFIETGINLNHVDIVCSINPKSNPEVWTKLAKHYAARFFFYRDDRPEPVSYISANRPWVLAKHFMSHKYLEDEAIFYHDCDMVFTKPFDFEKFEHDEINYGSDTRFYISHDYIIGKGEDVLHKMCEIVDVNPQLVKDNELNCIGAQYLLKSIDSDFWVNVYNDSERLFKELTPIGKQKKKENPNYHELQIWCADMWALLWNLWKRGSVTKVDPDFTFSWATSTEADWNKHYIFHNAGVTGPDKGLFYKGSFMEKAPFDSELIINPGSASKKYYELIKRTQSVL